MPWSPQRWNQSIQSVRSSLVQRDLAAASGHPCPLHGGEREDQEACRYWTEKARAHLAELRFHAEQAPDRETARQRVARLQFWAEKLPHSPEDCRTCCRTPEPVPLTERAGHLGYVPFQARGWPMLR